MLTATGQLEASPIVSRIATVFVYPLGIIICILSGAQLFTEQTATALFPILDRKAKLANLIRLWVIIIVGNLLGAAACAVLHCFASDEVVLV